MLALILVKAPAIQRSTTLMGWRTRSAIVFPSLVLNYAAQAARNQHLDPIEAPQERRSGSPQHKFAVAGYLANPMTCTSAWRRVAVQIYDIIIIIIGNGST